MKAIEKDFELARGRLKKAEADLARALDRLSAARDARDPASVTSARTAAQAAEKACAHEWERVERARQAYWRQRLLLAQTKLSATVPGLLGEIVTLSGYAGALVPAMPHEILRGLASSRLPPMATIETSIPSVPLESAVLDRAEDEIL